MTYARYALVRVTFLILTALTLLAVKALPRFHPARTFAEGRLSESRPLLLAAMIPPKGSARGGVRLALTCAATASTGLALAFDYLPF